MGAGAMANSEEKPGAETDVEAIHRPLLRELGEPEDGREPPPWWLWVIVAIALFWGGYYLGRYGGLFAPVPHLAFAPRTTQPDIELTAQTVEVSGPDLYQQYCASCHQADGTGVAGVFPPIVGAEWVIGDPGVLIRIVLHGMHGPVEVAGNRYEGLMPAWQNQLSDAQVAAILTHIRQLGENDAPPVESSEVAAVREQEADRQEPWTADELRALPEGDQ
jgi:mono/diheme cytochrome c family protein